MKTAIFVLFVFALTAIAVASPFENYFQKAKETFKQAVGGDSNPMVAGMQKCMDAFQFDNYQEMMHDTFSDMIENGSGEMKEQAQAMMTKFKELQDAGAKKEQYMDMMKQFQEMNKN